MILIYGGDCGVVSSLQNDRIKLNHFCLIPILTIFYLKVSNRLQF